MVAMVAVGGGVLNSVIIELCWLWVGFLLFIMLFSFRLSNSSSTCSGLCLYFSGKFRPPPATLAMVAGGGGRVCGVIGLLVGFR